MKKVPYCSQNPPVSPFSKGGKSNVLSIAAVAEGLTGLTLLVVPSMVVQWLFGSEIVGIGVVVSRIAGFSLIALGVACWPGEAASRALGGMLTYSIPTTLYLTYLGVGGRWAGKLLWPVVLLHAILTILLGRQAYFLRRNSRS